MCRIVIFGNSGSGKTSLAKRFARESGLPHLDLDEIAWIAADPPVRNPIDVSMTEIDRFTSRHQGWIIEGCYGSLIAHAAETATHMVFLNIGVDACVANCRARPWEAEKYPSKEAQDNNLEMLVDWVRDYDTRNDEFSLREHGRIFASFRGSKLELHSNTATRELSLPASA